ncbi:phage holin family protein [Thioclava sp. GXIMD4216]|uniref:Phage holin family protein n=1 Tax=Thioclava litoralis TaxID=3076557 RepID=A0ABZ1E479_9RHOB|nr:phage holin family protein [Thioclava sp. FTW29]
MNEHHPEHTTSPDTGLTDTALRAFEKGRQLGRDEMAFARAEIAQAGANLRVAAVCLGIALATAIALLAALSQTLVYALQAAGLAPVWAALITTVLLMLLGGLLALRAFVLLRRAAATPQTIITKISADLQNLKESLK